MLPSEQRGPAISLGTGSEGEARFLQEDGHCQNPEPCPVTLTQCEAERQVQYSACAALVRLEGQSCVA